jgi:hypothetical protein
MTTTSRQNNLILAEDWTRIYQTFRNADFTSYDFENLRRVMVAYLRENYPEDFNDYIESSEYIALIDLIAFLGQSLAFRIDLASRENFIELAERKESVLRLARMLSYNAKRNIAASGLLKFDSISTTETLFDSNGINLARQTIIWDDPTNANWFEQFITVLNATMIPNVEYGKSQGETTINGISTQQYRFNSVNADVPVFTFTKVTAGRSMAFELVSTSAVNSDSIYEEAPIPGNQMGFVYRQDGKSNASPNTGFFMLFKQGSLESADFSVTQPTVNEVVSISTTNINNDDVWLYSVDPAGSLSSFWTPVSSVVGNNIAYNSIANSRKNIYSVITKDNDAIDLQFSDGVFGNLPNGNFRLYYRVSNGLTYTINPGDMQGVTVSLKYRNASGLEHTLSIAMSLNYTVDSSTTTETVESIRTNAPALYYTQNRMITGEDYNLAPLSASQEILKVKAINRTSSGVSRNFDIIDASGKYSKINVFADDGLIYRTDTERSYVYQYTNKNVLLNYIKTVIEPAVSNFQTYNFYITNFDKIFTTDVNVKWIQATTADNASTGYFGNSFDSFPIKVGSYTTSNLKYVEVDSLVKFIPPLSTQAFKDGELVTYDPLDTLQKRYLWTKVVKVVGDGTNAGKGKLASGIGPITFSDVIPASAKPAQVVPRFVKNLSTDIETEILNLSFASQTFGLRYDVQSREWLVISASNIDLTSSFSLGQAGDNTNTNADASWVLAFVFDGDEYNVRVRGTDYVFASEQQNRFYFDGSEKIYDSRTRTVIKDQIKVLGINKTPIGKDIGVYNIADQILALRDSNPNFTVDQIVAIVDQNQNLKEDIGFEIADAKRTDDGYQSYDAIKIAFADSDNDGVIDNPDAFDEIVGIDTTNKYLFFKETTDDFGAKLLTYVPNVNNTFIIIDKEINASVNSYSHNQLVYFYDQAENIIKRVDLITRSFVIEPDYVAYVGRSSLKFQYIHNSNSNRRIDPSVSNIIDVYLLVRSYDTSYRLWLTGASTTMPQVPTPEELRVKFGTGLSEIKAISDEIVYHPVNYFPLFGDKASAEFQVSFKVVKNPNRTVNDNDLKVRIVNSISEFFSVENWDFGDRFYASELITYVITQNSPDISNMVLVPRQTNQAFGSLLEIQAQPDEILVSAATVDNIEILTNLTATELNLLASQIVTKTSV